jgi:hypothetical protein
MHGQQNIKSRDTYLHKIRIIIQLSCINTHSDYTNDCHFFVAS